MSDLAFSVIDARCEPYAAAPTLLLRLRIEETGGGKVQAVALRAQVQIDPRKRRYSPDEEERLPDLFGEPQRWGQTLRTLLWAQVSLTVPGFQGATEVDLPLPCTYDVEVGAAKYLQALCGGEIPLQILFSGTIFSETEGVLRVDQIPWEREVGYRLPARVWQEVMDRYFPGSAWIKVQRETLDALQRFKGRHSLASWDDVIEKLLREAPVRDEEEEPV